MKKVLDEKVPEAKKVDTRIHKKTNIYHVVKVTGSKGRLPANQDHNNLITQKEHEQWYNTDNCQIFSEHRLWIKRAESPIKPPRLA
jgi:hypothetical protein